MKFYDGLKALLSSNGGISFGRFASGVCLLFVLCWDTAFVVFGMIKLNWQFMHIGDVLPSPSALAAQAAFCATFYGINKGMNSFSKNSDPQGK